MMRRTPNTWLMRALLTLRLRWARAWPVGLLLLLLAGCGDGGGGGGY